LDLERRNEIALSRITSQIVEALDQAGAEAIVGMRRMADLARSLSDRFNVPVLDGVACAVRLAEALAALGLKTSKQRAYAMPIPKRYS
jgi:allantoin racemase